MVPTNERNNNYFKFPKDIEKRKKWLLFCEYPVEDAMNVGRKVTLCEKHFHEKDILRQRMIGGIDRLQFNAVPTIYTGN